MKKLQLLIAIFSFSFFVKAQTNTFPVEGNVGIGTTSPKAVLDVGAYIYDSKLGSVFGRLGEGNTTGEGTFLGVRGFTTQPSYVKSFAIEHSFYGYINSSINFFRGGGMTGGGLTFNTDDNTERMRITTVGNVGIGTTSPTEKLQVVGTIKSANLLLNDGDAVYFGNMNTYISGNTQGNLAFVGGGNVRMWVNNVGNIGIGTTSPGHYKLAVEGKIGARKVVVTQAAWADYVFETTYKLPSLQEVEAFIKQHKHLPDVPTAKEVEKNGIDLGENQAILLKKIEELTLYVFEQSKQLKEQQQTINVLNQRIEKLEITSNSK